MPSVTPASTVMTVRGPVPADDLGTTLPHEHVFLDLTQEYRSDGLLNDPTLAEAELRRYVDAGGRTLVDVTSGGLRGDPVALREMSERTGLHIVRGSGFYRKAYFPAELDELSTDAVADLVVRDIEEGVDGVRAGIIGEIGSDRVITALEERSFRAAARAHRRTGLTITTHAARWPVGTAQLDLLVEEGVDPGRVVIGHCDMVPDHDYHLGLARRGAWVQFDTVQGGSEYDTRQRLDWIRSLADAGHLDQVLLSQDVCLRTDYAAFGGPGYAYVVTTFADLLQSRGLRRRRPAPAARRQPAPDAHGRVAGRPYFSSAASSRSVGSAWAVRPRAVIVGEARIALRMASSVASMTASNSGFIAGLASVRTSATVGAPSSRRAIPRLPVAKARKRSPLEFPPVAAGAGDAEGRPLGEPAALQRQQRRVGRDDADDRAAPGGQRAVDARHDVQADLQPHRHAVDAEPLAAAVVGLHQHADRPLVISLADPSRRGPDAALEVVADHAGAAPDGPFSDRASGRGGVRRPRVGGGDVEAVDVVEGAVPGLGHDRERPGLDAVGQLLDLEGDECVADHAHAVGVGDRHGGVQQADLLEPGQAGHLAVAVEPVVGRIDGIAPHVAVVRHHDRDAGAHVVALDHGAVADPDAGHVGDRVVLARAPACRCRMPRSRALIRAAPWPGAGGTAPTHGGRRRAPARRRCGSPRPSRRAAW